MKRSFFRLIPILVLSFFTFTVSAQQVSNVNARLAGENVIITYDLVGAKVGQKFRIELYSSFDDYGTPLQNVSGDVGEDQLGGSGKQIEWQAKSELGVYTGSMTFEVRSTLTFSPIQITSPTSSSAFKPGKTMPINWTGGMPASTFQIDLLKSNTTLQSIGSTSNTSLYNWTIPKDVAKGTDYQIKMYDITDRVNTEVSSSLFQIKGKGGAGKFIIPIVAVGAVVGVLAALGGGNGDTDPDPVNTDLPGPPDPTGNVGGAAFKSGKRLISIPLFGN